jgi:hypothetical protein
MLPVIFHRETVLPSTMSIPTYQHLHLVTVLTFVPALKIAPRAPLGPSLVLNAGIPLEGRAFDLQKSAATKRETYDWLST